MKIFRNLLIILATCSAYLQAGLTLSLDRAQISVDESVNLILNYEDGGPSSTPSIPLPEGLKIISTSRQERMINFERSSSIHYTLQAEQPGEYKIGPFKLKGEDVEIPAVTLRVTKAKVVEATDNLFITLETTSTDLLVRETVEVTLTIYSRLTIGDIKILEFENEGFEITEWQQVQGRPQQIRQKIYQVRRFVARLTPHKAGTLTLDPTFRVDVLDAVDPYSRLFGNRSSRSLRVKLQNPLVLNVSAPPKEGQPETYAGHLGNFRLDARVSPNTVKVGDPLTLRVELSGSGSLQQALPPGMKESNDFKVYQPKLITEDMQQDGLSGRKIIEQVLIPKNATVTEVPALEFSYYDTDSRQYKTLTAGPFPLTVLPGDQTGSAAALSSLPDNTSLTEPQLLGNDLIYLKINPGRIHQLKQLQTGWGLVGSSTLPFALWALVGVICHRQEKRGQDTLGRRRQQAPKRLRKHLSTLDGDGQDVYAQIWRLLSDYLSARLNLPPGELHASDVVAQLPETIAEEQRIALNNWIQRCERARFSGDREPADGNSIRDDFRHFILAFDRELGR